MTQSLEASIRNSIIDVEGFPKPGVVFKDITPLLLDSVLRADTIRHFWERYQGAGITAVAGPESRGFLFGILLADAMHVPFVPIRKPGKLPREVYTQTYELEYGSDELQIHTDALKPQDSVVIIDDLLATGGTAEAACMLIGQTGASVYENAFVIELSELEGRKRLGAHAVHSLIKY